MGAWVPVDIVHSFPGRIPVAQSLIVKGSPGVGKTTFVIDLAGQLGKEIAFKRNYLDILTSEKTFLRRHARIMEELRPRDLGYVPEDAAPIWKVPSTRLENLEDSIRTATLGKEMLERIRLGGEPEDDYVPAQELPPGTNVNPNGEIESPGPRPPEPVDVEREPVLRELWGLYRFVERSLLLPALLIIDSVDALARFYGVSTSRVITTLQQDLVESGYANVVYVLEAGGKSPSDGLVDGVVEIVQVNSPRHRNSYLKLGRLGGRDIRQPVYTCSIEGGKIVSSLSDDETVELLLDSRRSARRAGIPLEIVEFFENSMAARKSLVVR